MMLLFLLRLENSNKDSKCNALYSVLLDNNKENTTAKILCSQKIFLY